MAFSRRLFLQTVGAAQNAPAAGCFDKVSLSSRLAAIGATVDSTDGADLIRFRDPDGIVIELNGRS